MKGLQISFSDIISDKDSRNIFAGVGRISLRDTLEKYFLKATEKAIEDKKYELSSEVISIFLKKLNLEKRERKQLSKKYELRVTETLLQILNSKKLKKSVYSKVDNTNLFNKYNVDSLYDFENILHNEEFNCELYTLLHKAIMEELSLAIKQADYFEECMRYQIVMIEKVKSYSLKLLKFIVGTLSFSDLIQLGMWIIDKIKEVIAKHRVGARFTCFFYF